MCYAVLAIPIQQELFWEKPSSTYDALVCKFVLELESQLVALPQAFMEEDLPQH